ncbi:hypothetical protein [Cupriavidus sp. UYPR2.512]|uniref:hypothetical protein n=1 Tax=Cupriavidus sp. UYPR2.512 TaxID=1080187 RepID=UPI000475E8AA|nr:hypothetical protein [Cupriavidus sp. UYPR2.512]UIF90051.1 hypothetical protein KAF44_40515 [Cupriavidus necator]
MNTPSQRRNLAVSVLCAVGLTLAAASAAHAAPSVSGFGRMDGAISHVGKVDPFLDGAKLGKVDPFTDGGKVSKPDPFTDGARSIHEARDPFTDGA